MTSPEILARKQLEAALEAKDYRHFLKLVFAASTREGKKFNYAAFSRKAGFSSRSFLKEMLEGEKRLTGLSFPKVLKALTLPSVLRNYLTFLVMLEEHELNYDKLTPAQIETKIANLSEKMANQLQQLENAQETASALYRSHQVLEVYSVLGNRQKGIDLAEVSKRTGINKEVCEKILQHLLSQKVITEKAGLYQSFSPHVTFQSLGKDMHFKSVYLESLGILKAKANARFEGQDQLFHQSYFSLDRHRLPELRRRLREVILEFVDSSGNDDGDCVGKLIVGFYT